MVNKNNVVLKANQSFKILLFFLLLIIPFANGNAQTTFHVLVREQSELKLAFQSPQSLISHKQNYGIDDVKPFLNNPQHNLSNWFTILSFDSLKTRQWILQQKDIEKWDLAKTYRLDNSDPDFPQQYHHDLIRTLDAHAISKGKNVKVGVIDTGIDFFHPEFEGQLFINSAEDKNQNGKFDPWSQDSLVNGVSGDLDGIDQDGNGFVDDVIGYDFTDQPRLLGGGDYLFEDPIPYDDNQHGTLVAGIIAAKPGNQIGGMGIATECKLLILRAFAGAGVGEDDDIARAIVYAADNGVQVLNFSFGDIYPSQIMLAAIQYAYQKGVVMVASAGNATGDSPHFPSGYDEVISVSASMLASNNKETLWPLSSYGNTVDLCAPGAGIFTTTRSDTAGLAKHDFFSGTSTSAPMVSAATAMLLAKFPDLSPIQVRGILTSTTFDIQKPGWDYYTGSGRLDLFQALNYPTSVNVQIHSPINRKGFSQDTVPIVTTVLHPLLQEWSLFYFEGDSLELNKQILTTSNQQHLASTTYLWNIQNLPDGTYNIALEVKLRDGKSLQRRSKIFIQRTTPVVELKEFHEIWENQELKWFWVYRANQAVNMILKLTKIPENQSFHFNFDKFTQNGGFVIGSKELPQGNYFFRLIATNASGKKDSSVTGNFSYQPQSIPLSTFEQKNYRIPAGHYLTPPFDFDNDLLPEIVFNKFDSTGSYSNVMLLMELNANQFVATDSLLSEAPRIPKDIDNGTFLTNLRDSIFLYFGSQFPKLNSKFLYEQRYYPAVFADTDKDGKREIIAKDFVDYVILEEENGDFVKIATLADTTSDYIGSTAPRIVAHDLDGDNFTDIAFGDFDGDIFIFENTGNNTYQQKWIWKTELEKSAEHICSGDLNGNGIPELIVTLRTSSLRNEDFEYDLPYWKILIFEAIGNDNYQKVGETYLFNHYSDTWNASTIADLDNDGTPEWIFSPFPKTYVLDYQNGNYQFQWFWYGNRQNTHPIGDYDKNGLPEIGLTIDDSTSFFEWNLPAQGLPDISALHVNTCGDSVFLKWAAVPNISQYLIWKGNPQTGLFSSYAIVNTNEWRDTLQLPQLLSVSSFQNSNFSNLSNAVYAFPHTPFFIDSVQIVSENILKVFSSQPLGENSQPTAFWVNQTPASLLIPTPQYSLLYLSEPLKIGNNQISIEKTLQDSFGGCLSEFQNVFLLNYLPENLKVLFITSWTAVNSKEAIITFNHSFSDTSMTLSKWVSSIGTIEWLEILASNQVKLKFKEAILGNMGYRVEVKIQNLFGTGGFQTYPNIGDLAVFASSPSELQEALVYPNPLNKSKHSEITFAKVPLGAEIQIFTLSGRAIRTIKVTEGLGGVKWPLTDLEGKIVPPGIYLYKVSHASGSFLGQFAIF